MSAALYSSQFKLGVSVNDLNSPAIRPVDYTFILYRYYIAHLEKSFAVSEQVKLQGSFRSNWVPSQYFSGVIDFAIHLKETIGLHAFAHSLLGWGCALNLQQPEINSGRWDLSFAYKIPYSNRPLGSQYEINIAYLLSKKQRSE